MISEVRVLAELIVQHEDEWENLDANRPGRAYYVADRLIAEGAIFEPSVLILKPGETLVLNVGEKCSEAQIATIREQITRRGIDAVVVGGIAKPPTRARHDERQAT